MVRLTDRPEMTLDVYRGRKTMQQQQLFILHVMIGMLSSHLMQSENIIYGLVRKCVKLSPFS